MTGIATELIPVLRAAAFILVAVWIVTGAVAKDASAMDKRTFRYWTAAVIVIGITGIPRLFGLVDDSIGLPLLVAGFAGGCFFGLLGLMRLVSAIVFVLGTLGALLLGGIAVAAGQPLIGGAIAVIYSIAVVFIMVRRVNAGD
jgi:hypothetical protein